MEAPENTSPKGLCPTLPYAASLWAQGCRPIASGELRIAEPEGLGYDGSFLITSLDTDTQLGPDNLPVAVSTGNYRTRPIRLIGDYVKGIGHRIYFVWADTES